RRRCGILSMLKWIGLCLGDVTGIGPEVTLKALTQRPPNPSVAYTLIGDAASLRRMNQQLGLGLEICGEDADPKPGRVLVCNPVVEPLPGDRPTGAAPAARADVEWLREAAQRCLRGELSAMVTAPVNKESIVRAGQPFVGQTELLSELAGTDRTAM